MIPLHVGKDTFCKIECVSVKYVMLPVSLDHNHIIGVVAIYSLIISLAGSKYELFMKLDVL